MNPNENTESKSKYEYKLQAMLAEYNALNSEYRDRMKIQHNLLQIHVTVLTAIIGAALSQLSTKFLLLIPIESSIFGIWYFDIAITMLEIGTYIKDKIKTEIQTDFNNKRIMGWENYFNEGEEYNFKKTIFFDLLSRCNPRHLISLGIAIGSFILPSLILLFMYLCVQGNNVFSTDIIYLITCDVIFLISFFLVVWHYICKSRKIYQGRRNKKNAVKNQLYQS